MIHLANPPRKTPVRQLVVNPWKLTCGEVDAMDAICAIGPFEEAANRLRITTETLKSVLYRVRGKMNKKHTRLAAIEWDRWRQGAGKDVPA